MDKLRRNEFKGQCFQIGIFSFFRSVEVKFPGTQNTHTGGNCFLIQDDQGCSMEQGLWRRTCDRQGMEVGRQTEEELTWLRSNYWPRPSLVAQARWAVTGEGAAGQQPQLPPGVLRSNSTCSFLAETGRRCLPHAEDKEGPWWQLPGA